MRTSTANSANSANSADTTTASNRAQLSAFDPRIFELTDQVVLTFPASDTCDAPHNLATAPTPGKAHSAGQPIRINGWRLTLRGGPSTGDSHTIEGVLSTPVLIDPVRQGFGNAGGMLALPATALSGDVPPDDGCAALLSSFGAAQMVIDTKGACSRVACVNPDDESARLFQLQQSYQAAAQFLHVAQSRLDTLLQAVQADHEEKP